MILLSSLEPPRIGIRLKEEDTLVYIANNCKGAGTLYITENNIVWINNNNEGFILKYLDLSVFAVCTDLEKYPEPCIYMLVQDENSAEEDDSESDSEDACGKEVEIRFAPIQGTNVHDLFNCIQDCNRLHSVANEDASSSGCDEDDLADYENAPMNGTDNGDSENNNDGQFDDVE